VIDAEVPLAKVADGLARLNTGDQFGKLIVRP
jgi:hypothetical protein